MRRPTPLPPPPGAPDPESDRPDAADPSPRRRPSRRARSADAGATASSGSEAPPAPDAAPVPADAQETAPIPPFASFAAPLAGPRETQARPDAQATEPIPPLLAFPREASAPSRPGPPAAPLGDPAATASDRATTEGPAVAADAAAPDAAGPEVVGWRDVWRATRARRRAMRAEVRRFTGRQRRRRAVWLGVAGALVLLVAGSFAAAYSPLFAVERVTVAGAQQLDPAAVGSALSSIVGTPLPLVDESAVEAALVGFPLVESYTLEARPPHELVVRLVERTPVGVIGSPAGYTLVDAAGVALSTSQTLPPGYPTLSIPGGIGSDAFTAAGTVVRALPADLRAQLAEVTASSPDDVAFTLTGSGARVVWGSADQSALKALVLQKTMAARPPAPGSTYDVSSPEAVVVG